MAVRSWVPGWLILVASTMAVVNGFGQMPDTAGETLSGKRIILAEQVRGHAVVLVAGFSHEAGNGTGAWVKAIHADPALAGVSVYEIAEIAGAPSLIRGMIKSGMKKGVPAAEQDNFVVLTEDAKPWRSYFEVGDDQVPYVMLLDPSGKILWHGHGSASDLEPQLKAALH
jgi:ATP10 protein